MTTWCVPRPTNRICIKPLKALGRMGRLGVATSTPNRVMAAPSIVGCRFIIRHQRSKRNGVEWPHSLWSNGREPVKTSLFISVSMTSAVCSPVPRVLPDWCKGTGELRIACTGSRMFHCTRTKPLTQTSVLRPIGQSFARSSSPWQDAWASPRLPLPSGGLPISLSRFSSLYNETTLPLTGKSPGFFPLKSRCIW